MSSEAASSRRIIEQGPDDPWSEDADRGVARRGLGVSLDEPLLHAEEAAELLKVKVSWLRAATRAGQLPCVRIGRYVRYTRPMLEAWLVKHRVNGSPPVSRRNRV